MLTAIAIPVFSSQLEKSREATDMANIRSAYATLVADYLNNTGSATAKSIVVPAQQKESGWTTGFNNNLETMKDGTITQVSVPAGTTQYTVTITAAGDISVSAS